MNYELFVVEIADDLLILLRCLEGESSGPIEIVVPVQIEFARILIACSLKSFPFEIRDELDSE